MTLYARQSGVEVAPMQDETVLFNPATKKFCVLNETAAHLWMLLEQPRAEAELAAGLCDEFDGVDPGVAARDVRATLNQLVDLGVVNTVAAADASA